MEMESNNSSEKDPKVLEKTLFSKIIVIVRTCFGMVGLVCFCWIIYQGYQGVNKSREISELVNEFSNEGLSDNLCIKLASFSDKSDAYTYLGTCYLRGEEVVQDDSRMLKWYNKAANLDNPTAQYNLALLYAYGEHGVNKDVKEALRLFYQVTANPQATDEIKNKADDKIKELVK